MGCRVVAPRSLEGAEGLVVRGLNLRAREACTTGLQGALRTRRSAAMVTPGRRSPTEKPDRAAHFEGARHTGMEHREPSLSAPPPPKHGDGLAATR